MHLPAQVPLRVEPYRDGTSSLPRLPVLTASQYWGWSKFRYRDDDKDTFEEAKVSAKKWLDECPLPVIRRFINRTWRFIDAYERGLKPAAKEWAARPQKQHRNAAESAMVLLEQ